MNRLLLLLLFICTIAPGQAWYGAAAPEGACTTGQLYYQTNVETWRCVEIGYQTDGADTSPQAAAKWGENATDCAENETNTTDCAGWVEFSNTITFAGELATAQGAFRGRIK